MLQYKKLQLRKYRDKKKQFIVEGEHLVLEAYKTGCIDELILEKDEIFPLNVETVYVTNEIINKILIIASYIILLYRTFKVAVKMLIKSHTINENALITISAIGAYFVDKQMEGLMVITLYEIGKILEEKAVNNSRNSIKDLMNIKQDFANKVVGDKTEVINVEDVKINDILIIKKGEKIPVDGVVIEGET